MALMAISLISCKEPAPEGTEEKGEGLKSFIERRMAWLDGKFNIKEGETSPPKRYNSGSLILAMENAGQLIEDEELRAQIKGR